MKGDTGVKGDMGKLGLLGVKGRVGVQGDIGRNGITGSPGDAGLKGESGDDVRFSFLDCMCVCLSVCVFLSSLSVFSLYIHASCLACSYFLSNSQGLKGHRGFMGRKGDTGEKVSAITTKKLHIFAINGSL